MLSSMPALQLFFAVMFFLVPGIGFNMLLASHYRRVGKSRSQGFNAFIFPFSELNSRERYIFAAILAATISFALLGMSYDCNCA